MLCQTKATAAVLCMGTAFVLLFASLHTNQIMIQPEYKDGSLNPAYVDGFAKHVYAVLHDLNPCGQAAQLTTMEIFHSVRWVLCDIGWIFAAGISCIAFQHKNIK